MNLVTSALTIVALAMGAPPLLTLQDAKRDARAVAEAWLVVQDAARDGDAWDALASAVKKDMTRGQWGRLMEMLREGTGKLTSRGTPKVLYTEFAPGLPEGTYVLVAYRSDWEKHAPTDEIVTVILDTDGKWRVCGYRVVWKRQEAASQSPAGH